MRVQAGAPITTVRSVIAALQCGHSHPSTRNTRCSSSAWVNLCSARSERVVPGRVNRFASRAARCASVDVGTRGTTSARQTAFPAEEPH